MTCFVCVEFRNSGCIFIYFDDVRSFALPSTQFSVVPNVTKCFLYLGAQLAKYLKTKQVQMTPSFYTFLSAVGRICGRVSLFRPAMKCGSIVSSSYMCAMLCMALAMTESSRVSKRERFFSPSGFVENDTGKNDAFIRKANLKTLAGFSLVLKLSGQFEFDKII